MKRLAMTLAVVVGACGGGGHESADAGGDAAVDAAPVPATWTNRSAPPLPDPWPSARTGQGMAFDAARGASVMFGGTTFVPGDPAFDEVWEWDDAAGTWSNPAPVPRPPASDEPAVAYDAGRAKTFVFAGGQAWEWDGVVFASRTPEPLPASWPADGASGRAVYDGDRGVVVAVFDDGSVWEWEGGAGTWTERTPATGPAARRGGALAYDGRAHRTLMFGGRAGDSDLGDLWAWDGAAGTWVDLTPEPLPAAWPDARTKAALSFDAAVGRVDLYGGINSGDVLLTDLWGWDGSAWTDRTIVPLPTAWPAEHVGMAMTYDSIQDREVMFGGILSGEVAARDLWDLQ